MQFKGLKNGVVMRFFKGIKKPPIFWGIFLRSSGKFHLNGILHLGGKIATAKLIATALKLL